MKIKQTILSGIIICVSAWNVFAQQWDKQLLKSTYASYGEEVIKAADGNYVFVGRTVENGEKVCVTKTDANGSIIWQKYYGSTYSTGTNKGYSICQLNDGNYVIGGQFKPNVTGATDIGFLLKIDATGNPITQKQFVANYNCTPCPSFSFVKCVRATSDGGFIAAGRQGASVPTGIIMKCDVNLNITWSKYYTVASPPTISDLYSIEKTSDGGYIACGTTGDYKISLLKIDASGNLTWFKKYNWVTGNSFESGYSVKQTTDGGYICSGYSSTLGGCAFVIKTDANGSTQWAQRITPSSAKQLFSYSVLQTSDGGFAVGIYSVYGPLFASFPGIVKLNSNGTLLWTKSYRNSVTRLMQVSDSYGTSLVGTGTTSSSGIYLFKTDANGINCTTQTPSITLNGIAPVSSSPSVITNSYVEPYSVYAITYGTSTLTLSSNCCIANAGIDKSNTNDPCCIPQCSSVQIGTTALSGYTYTWTPSTSLSCTNCAQPNASPCSPTTYTISAYGGEGCLINKDAVKDSTSSVEVCCRKALTTSKTDETFNIFPNPSNGIITIELGNHPINYLEIIDLTGRIIYENKNVQEKTLTLDLSSQSKGIYLIKATTDSGEINRKITLE